MEGAAWACNFCKEDNRAAVYSYEAVQKVQASPGRFEFVVVKIIGKLQPNDDKALEDWLKLKPGIDPDTVRISIHQKAIGFVLDITAAKKEIVRDLQRAFPELTFRVLSLKSADPTS